MFWRKESTKESNRGLPSDSKESYFLSRSKVWGEHTDTSAVRVEANASYAARCISAPVCIAADT